MSMLVYLCLCCTVLTMLRCMALQPGRPREIRMSAVLDVTISAASTATVAGERVTKGRHRTINDAAMDRCKEIARARRERVAVCARAANGREHWIWAYSDGKVARMNEGEIQVAERLHQSAVESGPP